MAITRGCYGKVMIDATADVAIAEVNQWTLEHTAEVLDSSSIGTCTKSYTVGATTWSGTLTCWWDATDSTGQEVLTVGSTVALIFKPSGEDTGDATYAGSAIISGISRSGGVDGIVQAVFSFTGTTALTQGTVT